METKFCQSCGMPLQTEQESGTNQDGTKNDEYCVYCFKDGAFTKNVSMEEMIQDCLQYLDEFNKDSQVSYTKEDAIKEMRQFFPTLKRWKQN